MSTGEEGPEESLEVCCTAAAVASVNIPERIGEARVIAAAILAEIILEGLEVVELAPLEFSRRNSI